MALKIIAVAVFCASSFALHAQEKWNTAAISIYGGAPSSIYQNRFYAEYFSKIASTPAALEKVYFDTREKNTYDVTTGEINNKKSFNVGGEVIFKGKKTWGKFISAREIHTGLSLQKSAANITYTSQKKSPNQTQTATAIYKLQFTDVRINFGYYFYTPVLAKYADIYTGINLYGSFTLGSKIEAQPTIQKTTNYDDNGNETSTVTNQLFAGTTSFFSPWLNYGLQVPLGLNIKISGSSSILANYYLDFNFRSYNAGNTRDDVYKGFNLGYRYNF